VTVLDHDEMVMCERVPVPASADGMATNDAATAATRDFSRDIRLSPLRFKTVGRKPRFRSTGISERTATPAFGKGKKGSKPCDCDACELLGLATVREQLPIGQAFTSTRPPNGRSTGSLDRMSSRPARRGRSRFVRRVDPPVA
jgi:hypothetical protein